MEAGVRAGPPPWGSQRRDTYEYSYISSKSPARVRLSAELTGVWHGDFVP